jgi:hypothetical protein
MKQSLMKLATIKHAKIVDEKKHGEFHLKS